MELKFDKGDPRQPKGHALLYYRSGNDPNAVVATYVIVLPIPIELGKYIPPMFAARMPDLAGGSPGVVPMPPIPEPVESLAYLERLASIRGDDLIAGGALALDDLQQAMQTTVQMAQRYLELYGEFARSIERGARDQSSPSVPEELNVHEVMYSLMGERDLLAELSKLTGQLRYAVDGGDSRLMADTEAEMERLGKYLPPKYRVAEFIGAARLPGERGRRLAALYMDRSYKLHHEDYARLATVEAELKALLEQQDH